MRVRFLSLPAAAGLLIFLCGTASAQTRSFALSNIGNPGATTHQPSFGMANHAFSLSNLGNRGANPIIPYTGTQSGAGAVPFNAMSNQAGLDGAAPAGSGVTAAAPGMGYPTPAGTQIPNESGLPSNTAIPAGTTAAPAAAYGAFTTPAGVPMTAPAAAAGVNPLSYGTFGTSLTIPTPAAGLNPLTSGTNGTAAPISTTYVPGGVLPQGVYAPYTGPQYQGSFFEPLRQVYGYRGY